MELGKIEIPNNIKYYYIALIRCLDYNLYELDSEWLSPLIKGSSSKISYILNESK
jgi:hypothetical protein